ncbi:MAG: PDZ domain-containing protein, partial [Phycisphaerales bacterium]
GHYDRRPQLFQSLQTLENDALRSFLKLDKASNGIVVISSSKNAANPLQKWDVIDRIGDHDVDDAGMVSVKANLRLSFEYFVPKLAKDGVIELGIFRDGQKMTVQVPVHPKRNRLIKSLDGEYPSYFILGALRFTPAYEEHRAIDARLLASRGSPILSRWSDEPAFEGEEMVVGPFQMFTHATSKGYDAGLFPVLKSVNGEKVKNLRHLVELLRDLKSEYVVFDWYDDGVESVVFRYEDLVRSTDEILEDNGIRNQMSDDLKSVWDKK